MVAPTTATTTTTNTAPLGHLYRTAMSPPGVGWSFINRCLNQFSSGPRTATWVICHSRWGARVSELGHNKFSSRTVLCPVISTLVRACSVRFALLTIISPLACLSRVDRCQWATVTDRLAYQTFWLLSICVDFKFQFNKVGMINRVTV